MAQLRVSAVFQGQSGLAKDEYENGFHFSTPSGAGVAATQAECATAAARVANFYTGAAAGGGGGICAYMSGAINFTALMKVYDYFGGSGGSPGSPDLGPPKAVYSWSTLISLSNPGLPEEVALCLSYYSSSNTARHRGRLYLGPWGTNSFLGVEPRPGSGLINAMKTAGSRLVADGTSAQSTGGLTAVTPVGTVPSAVDGVNWYLRSRVGSGSGSAPVPVWERVLKGWIDDEWDAQRRRRVEATSRVTFP
jgi:hypothetical protein